MNSNGLLSVNRSSKVSTEMQMANSMVDKRVRPLIVIDRNATVPIHHIRLPFPFVFFPIFYVNIYERRIFENANGIVGFVDILYANLVTKIVQPFR